MDFESVVEYEEPYDWKHFILIMLAVYLSGIYNYVKFDNEIILELNISV